jgi:hypothetical protein
MPSILALDGADFWNLARFYDSQIGSSELGGVS